MSVACFNEQAAEKIDASSPSFAITQTRRNILVRVQRAHDDHRSLHETTLLVANHPGHVTMDTHQLDRLIVKSIIEVKLIHKFPSICAVFKQGFWSQ